MATNRDNFTPGVKKLLAERAGHTCSVPGCGRRTVGASLTDSKKAVRMGKAAHITAASVNGPRYDASLTPEQRKSAENGLWACSYCADLIDNDPASYPVDLLRKWKVDREREAAAALVPGSGATGGGVTGLAFEPFYYGDHHRVEWIDGRKLGFKSGVGLGPWSLEGTDTVGIIRNDSGKLVTGVTVKAELPSGKKVTLPVMQTEINPRDTGEFVLCTTGSGETKDKIVGIFGDEVVYPLPTAFKVTVRVTTREGAYFEQEIEFTQADEPTLP